jgi:GT2 family glycosyltransferase
MVDVSVVIVNWNTRDLLRQTLTTLHQETAGIDFETIVVDNGSTDGSAEMVSREWAGVHLISSPVNLGFAGGNNLGFRQSRGRYILLLNSDTIVLSSTLPVMTAFLDEHPEAGCVGCRHLNDDRTLQRSMDTFPSLMNDFLSYTELHRLKIFRPYLLRNFAWWSDHDVTREIDWVNGACMMVRYEILEQIGGLDEGFFIYAEEIDWCYRIRQAGWKIYFTPESEIIHLGGKAMDRVPDRRIILKYTGQYRFYSKHYPFRKRLLFRALVSFIALSRIFLITFLMITKPLWKSIGTSRWELFTQESVMTEPGTMIRAWWKILWSLGKPWNARRESQP